MTLNECLAEPNAFNVVVGIRNVQDSEPSMSAQTKGLKAGGAADVMYGIKAMPHSQGQPNSRKIGERLIHW